MIYITRHGQTDWNAIQKVMGRYDEPLNKVGMEQAKITSENIKNTEIDLIICSPLKRAKQTAEIINKDRHIPIIYDDRIIERDFGEFEGLNISEFDFNSYWNYNLNNEYQSAENIQIFFKRIYSFLNDILIKYVDKNVLIVTHAGVSIPIECYFNNYIPKGSLIEAELSINNCQIKAYSVKEKR